MQHRAGAADRAARGFSTAAVQLHGARPEQGAIASPLSPASAGATASIRSAATVVVTALTQRVCIWLAAPKRKVLFQSSCIACSVGACSDRVKKELPKNGPPVQSE